jgi:hypothetical protein
VESAGIRAYGSVQARTVGVTAPEVDEVVADKAQTPLPTLGTTCPLGLKEQKVSRFL